MITGRTENDFTETQKVEPDEMSLRAVPVVLTR